MSRCNAQVTNGLHSGGVDRVLRDLVGEMKIFDVSVWVYDRGRVTYLDAECHRYTVGVSEMHRRCSRRTGLRAVRCISRGRNRDRRAGNARVKIVIDVCSYLIIALG